MEVYKSPLLDTESFSGIGHQRLSDLVKSFDNCRNLLKVTFKKEQNKLFTIKMTKMNIIELEPFFKILMKLNVPKHAGEKRLSIFREISTNI